MRVSPSVRLSRSRAPLSRRSRISESRLTSAIVMVASEPIRKTKAAARQQIQLSRLWSMLTWVLTSWLAKGTMRSPTSF